MTDTPYTVPPEVAAHVVALADAGRIIRGEWSSGAREYVCALAAFGPDIYSPDDCPAEYMPGWLAQLIPTLDDGLFDDRAANVFGRQLGERAAKWSVVTAKGWTRVSVGFRVACIEQALEAAEAVQPTPRPDYWDQVHGACGMVLAALRSDQPAGVARAAAGAAAKAARAAAGIARAAAEVAAWPAEAAWAAEAAEAAVWAAPGAAAYQRLIDTLMALIDAEIAR